MGNGVEGPQKRKNKEQGVRKRWPIYPTEACRRVSRQTCSFPSSTALCDVRKSWCSSGDRERGKGGGGEHAFVITQKRTLMSRDGFEWIFQVHPRRTKGPRGRGAVFAGHELSGGS